MKYQHKKTGKIVDAVLYRKGMETGFVKGNRYPYIAVTINNTLDAVRVTRDDYIIRYGIGDRIYTTLCPKDVFRRKFERVK